MTPRRRIEMVVEQDEIILVRRRGKAVRLWCNQCEAQVSMLRVEDARTVAQTTSRTIYRWIEAGKLHFAESDKGLVLICAQSLAAVTDPDRSTEGKTGSLTLEELGHRPGTRREKG